MKVIIISPGRSKEKYWLQAEKEYIKRLTRYTKLDLISIQEERARGKLATGDIDKIKEKEASSILKKIPSSSFVVLLDPTGLELSSEGFAEFLDRRRLSSTKNLVFVIGGFLGLSEELKKRADLLLSFSKLTFTHDMMPTLLLEQLYRGFGILAGSPYHK